MPSPKKNRRKTAVPRGADVHTEEGLVGGARRVAIDSPPVLLDEVKSVSMENPESTIRGRIAKWFCPIHLTVAGAALLGIGLLKADPSIQNMVFCGAMVYAEVLLAKITAKSK